MKTFKFLLFLSLVFNFIELRAQLFQNSIVAQYTADSINIINNGVDVIYDISGSNQDLTQTTIGRRPSPNIDNFRINNFNSLYFDGIDDRLTTTFSNTLPQGFTIFIILNSPISRSQTLFDQITSPYCFLYYQQNSSKFIQNSGVSQYSNATNGQFDFTVFEVQFNNQNSIVKKNKNPLIQGSSGNNSLSGISLASSANGGSPYLGEFVELIVYNQNFSVAEGDSITDFLMDKYAPAVDLGPDISMSYGFCDTILSTPNYYTSYLWSTGSIDSSIVINDPGLYWLEGIDIFGRTSRDTILIERPPFDELDIQNQLVCFNRPDTITANIPLGNYTFDQWSDGNTNIMRILTESETIFYSVLDSLGCIRTSNTANISIDSSLENISLGVDTSLCVGNSVQLVQSSPTITDYLWNTGNITSNQVVDTSGIYILDVINDNGCENADTIEVTVIGTAPALSYSIENEICQGSEFNFSESSTVPPGNNISEVVWNFGELDSVFLSMGTQVYLDSGIYIGFLEVSTLEGCSSKENFVVEVFPKPIISFETTNYCPYEEIGFTPSNNYAVPLNSFSWNFDQNGNTSTEHFPSYSYGLTGNYDVELVAIDSNSCIDTVVQSVYVQPAPFADISIVNPCELNALEISDNSSITDTFSIVTYAWNYGDNTSAINPTEEKSFEEYGAYTVQLVLTADNGCVDSTEQNITVHPNPILNYEVGPACMNTWTNLSDLSEIPLGSLSESNWLINLQFSDNQTNTAFKFPTKGIQLIALQSTSDQGCVRDTSFTIDVAEELSAEFTVTPNTLITETPMLFTNQSLNIDSSYWDFGNGNGLEYNINNLNEVTYESGLNGSSIDVMLIVNNQLGCRDTSVQTFTIKEAFYDLAIETIFVQDINGYLTVGAEIQNLGSIPLENADLFLKTPENGSIQESWTGSIAQDASEIYIFNAHPTSYISSQDETDRYVCVEGIGVNSLGSPDVNPNNNTTCKNIESTGLIVLPIYPNPTEDDITISILLTESSVLNIELVDQSGRLIYSQNNPEGLEPGIHNIQLPFSQLNKGIYYVRVSDDATTLLEKIVRL